MGALLSLMGAMTRCARGAREDSATHEWRQAQVPLHGDGINPAHATRRRTTSKEFPC